MHSSGWMKYMLSASVVYMQSTGQTSRQLASFTSMHGSVITYAISSQFLHSSARVGVSKCIIANAYERNRRVPLAERRDRRRAIHRETGYREIREDRQRDREGH